MKAKNKDNEKSKLRRKLKRMLITFSIFAVFLIIMIVLRQIDAANSFLFLHLSRNINEAMGKITGLVSFSIYEIFLYCIISFLLFSLIFAIVLLFKRRWLKAATRAVSILLAAVIVSTIYFASAGFAYANLSEMLAFNGQKATQEQLKQMCDYFLADFNNLALKFERDEAGMIIAPYDDQTLAKKLIEEYKRFDLDYSYTPNCKTISSSRIMSEMGVSGVYFAPLGEANINANMPASERPFTMAHELAHSKGIMREDEADMMAALVTLTSTDDYIRYSGYIRRIYYLFDAFGLYNDYLTANSYYDACDPIIMRERISNYEHWSKYDLLSGAIYKVSSFFIDLYLKVMGQKEGSNAYVPDGGVPLDPEDPVIVIPTPPTDPTDPTNPTEPDPTNPIEPIEPNEPAEPIEPNEPEILYPIFSTTQRLFIYIYNNSMS